MIQFETIPHLYNVTARVCWFGFGVKFCLQPNMHVHKALNISSRRKDHGKVVVTKVLCERIDCKHWVDGECAQMKA
jgi:hypothetical protein